MAYSFYPNVSNASPAVVTPKIARFLIDDLAGFAWGGGTPWTVIQTYSSAAAAPFEVPADPADMDSLAADNGWRTGTLVAGDYIVLESGSGLYQVLIEWQGGAVINTITAPSGGFDPAAHQVDPENAANWLNPRIALVAHTCPAGIANWSVIANETGEDFIFWAEDAVTFVIGCSAKLANAFAGDANPVVTYWKPAEVYCFPGNGFTGPSWYRLSAMDGTTQLTLYGSFLGNSAVTMLTYGNGVTTYTNDADGTGSYRTLEIWLSSVTAGHIGLQGTLPSAYNGDAQLFGIGTQTINAKAYGTIKNASASYANIVFPWDGVTAL